MYQNELGVPKDLGQAVAWYRKAAEQGLAAAQTNLGVMYQDGWGARAGSCLVPESRPTGIRSSRRELERHCGNGFQQHSFKWAAYPCNSEHDY
jgi:TPR repeat protein